MQMPEKMQDRNHSALTGPMSGHMNGEQNEISTPLRPGSFFTRKYIRKYKFEWWFHVAPMVHVVHDGEVKERIMDIKYSKGPLKLKQWTDIFMRDSAHCRVVDKYTDQANFPESGSCFVMKSSMYYYQPIDLELLEVQGQEKMRWLEPEVRHAYMDAFQVTL